MKVLTRVGGAFIALALVLGLAPQLAAAQPPALITVPAVQEWQPGSNNNFAWKGREIYVADPALTDVAETFAEDIEHLTGTKPRQVNGSKGKPGSIVLTLGDQGHGDESYSLAIDKTLTITGTTDHGVFNGTRTVLQLLGQSEKIPYGDVLDWPEYEVRSVLMDNTARHFSMDWWNNFFRTMSYVKLNDTNLYLDGVGMDTDEMRELDALAQKYFIKLVPQVNMPSHMAVLLPSHPEYQLENQDGTKDPQALDLTNPEAWEWSFSLIDQYIDIFSSDEWHIGTDEFPGWPGTGENHPQLDAYAKEQYGSDATFADLFAAYQNAAVERVRSHGKEPRVWNDMVRQSSVVKLDPDVTVEYWIQHDALPGLLSAPEIAERGNPMINAHVDWMYYDMSKRNLDPRDIYEVFEVTGFPYRDDVPAESVRGARMAVWLAWIYTPMEADAEVLNNVTPSMFALAQKTWGSEKPVETWDEFRPIMDAVGDAPGLATESTNSIQPNPAGAVNADKSIVFFARDAEGQLWSGKQTAPGDTHFVPEVVATDIAGDPVVTTLDDGRLQVAARTTSNRLAIVTQDEPNSSQFSSQVLDVRVDTTPALVPGTAVVNNNGKLEAVDTATGATTRIAQNVEGSPAAAQVEGQLYVASASKHGSLIATSGDDWTVATSTTHLDSDPDVVAANGAPVVTAVAEDGSLASGSVEGTSVQWQTILETAQGQQATAVGPNGQAQVVVRGEGKSLMHAWLSDGVWDSAKAADDVITDPSLSINSKSEPFIYAQTGRLTQLVVTKTGGTYYSNHLAEATVGLTAGVMDHLDRPAYFVATEYGDLQTGTKWGNLWEWGRDFAIGTMSYPDDDLTPDQFTTMLLDDQFTDDTSGDYEVMQLNADEEAAAPTVADGDLSVSSNDPFNTTLVSDVPVAAGDTVVITEITEQLAEAVNHNTVSVGFVRDDDNHSMMWSSATANRIGFVTETEGRVTANGGYGDVPAVVKEGDKIATVLTGNWMVGYVQRDGVWHRVHAGIVNGHDNLRDPEVRAQYRYAIGLRGDAGQISVGEFVAAER